MSKVSNIVKKVSFYLMLVIVVFVFFFNRIVSIILAGSIFIIYLMIYLITLSSKKRLLRMLQEYSIISDNEIASKIKRPIDDIRDIFHALYKKQKNKRWLIVSLNQRYIFFSENAVEYIQQLFEQGYTEKQILENLLQRNMKIRSRAEVKAVENTLANQNRLRSRNLIQSKDKAIKR
ncbi:MAG: hypothetical protein ACFFG0_47755 [Candidatus Thorarchaeota archaeon]